MTKLKIGAITYDVIYTKDIIKADKEGEEYECWGDIDYDKQKVRICKTAPKERLKITLLHEAIHAIDKEYETRLTEPTVACLANGIMAMFQRNSWMKKKLLE